MARKNDELLDHEADGIHEFDNQLPRWWLYGFYFTILFAAAYLVNYHLLSTPLVGHRGMVAEYEAELEAAARTAPARPAAAAPAAGLVAVTDPAALARGAAIFNGEKNVCFSCHRQDLGGLIGPNLTDDLWLNGCSVGDVMTSIRKGNPMRGMLPYGSDSPVSDEELLQLASYVLSKRGTSPANPKPPDPERDKTCR